MKTFTQQGAQDFDAYALKQIADHAARLARHMPECEKSPIFANLRDALKAVLEAQ